MEVFRAIARAVRRPVPPSANGSTPTDIATPEIAKAASDPHGSRGPKRASDVLAELRRRPGAPTDEAAFLTWCNERDPSEPPGLSRFLFAVWRGRADLNEAFPGVYLDAGSRLRLQLWAHHFLAGEIGAPPELIPSAPAGIVDLAEPVDDGPATTLVPGVAIVGYLRAILGLGEAGRRLVDLCTLAGERVRALPYDHTDSPLGLAWPDPDPADTDALDVVVLAVNGAEAPTVRRALGNLQTRGRYVIGLWFWELDEFPPYMAIGFDAVDEVWATSEFTANAIRHAAPPRARIQVIPLGAPIAEVPIDAPGALRLRYGIAPQATVVGTMFDYASRIERKNPIGLVEAWIRAFPKPDPQHRVLVVKTLNGPDFADQEALVRRAVAGRSDIVLRDENLSADDREALIAMFDVIASLHRSEGYGLLLLDGMARGKPVVATGYSGNLAFMDEHNSWLVPHSMQSIDVDAGPYRAGGQWADPDLDSAANTLRTVVESIHDESVTTRARRAATDVAPLIDGSLGAAFVRDRLAAIRAERKSEASR